MRLAPLLLAALSGIASAAPPQALKTVGVRVTPQAAAPANLSLGRVGLWSPSIGGDANKPLWRNADGTDTVLGAGGGGGSSLPDMTGNAGRFLTTDGSAAAWAGPGTVGTLYAGTVWNSAGSLTLKAGAEALTLASIATGNRLQRSANVWLEMRDTDARLVTVGGGPSPTFVGVNYNFAGIELNVANGGTTIQTIVGAHRPASDNAVTLGSVAQRWSTVYATAINSGTGASLSISGQLGISFIYNGVQKFAIGGNSFDPISDNAQTLGSLGAWRFASVRTLAIESGASTLTHTSGIADAASVVAHAFDTTATLAGGGAPAANTARIASFRNGGVEKAAIGRDGNIYVNSVWKTNMTATTGVSWDATTSVFIYANGVNSGTFTAGSLEPGTDNTITLATAAKRWIDVVAVKHTSLIPGIGTAQTVGFTAQNLTPATVGAQSYSPVIEMVGQGWKTNATAASQEAKIGLQVRPVQGSSVPIPALDIMRSINGAAYTTIATISADALNNTWGLGFNGTSTASGTTHGIIAAAGEMKIAINGTEVADFTTSSLDPRLDNARALGTTSFRWSAIHSYVHAGAIQTKSPAATVTIDPTLGEFVRVTLSSTAITSIVLQAGANNQILTVEITNDATPRTVPSTWGSNVKFAGGAFAVTASANAIDQVTFRFQGATSRWIEISRTLNLQ